MIEGTRRFVRILFAAWISIAVVAASEHHGVVKFGGLPIPGATVTASSADKKLTVVTGPDGTYSFPNLTDGVWSVEVDMLCFRPGKQDVTVGASAPAIDWDLTLLSLDEIKASAPPSVTPAPVSLSVNASPATATAPTSAADAKPAAKGKKDAKTVAAAAKPTSSAFQRADVTASNTPPPPDAAPAEASTQSASDSFAINGSSNNGAASPFGTSGAFGNNRRGPGSLYNGSVAGSFVNSVLNARDYSITGQDTPKPGYNHLQFAGTVGGPLRIPRLWNNNSAPAFTVSYQLIRNRNATTITSLVPTQDQRNGIIGDTVIPQSIISPQALALLKYYPLPNFGSGTGYNYQTAVTGIMDSDAVSTRLSKNVGRGNQVFGTFAYQNTRSQTTSLFGFQDISTTLGIDTTLNWSHRFSQRIFTTFKFEYNRLSALSTPYFANKVNVSGIAGITGNDQSPLNYGPPSLSFSSGIAGLTDAQESFNRSQTTAGSFNTFWSRSPHNFTFGADYKRLGYNYLGQQNARGAFGFTGAATGNDFVDFLTGVPDTSTIAFGNADKYFRSSLYDAYLQDDWRVSPSLTLNIGVRWEYTAPITELYGRLVNLDITPGFGAAAPVVANNPVGSLTGQHYADSLVHPDRHAFQPKIGLAWRPISGSSLVVRSGYGVNYNTSVYQAIATQMAQQSPLSKSLSVQNNAADPLTLANGFNASPNTTQNTFAIDPNFKIGYVQSWNVSVQRDLPGSLVMIANYLGIRGTRAQQEFLPNTYAVGAVNPCPSCLAGYTYLASNGNSSRHAGQIQLRRRLHNGITATVQYTYSKAIDDAAALGRPTAAPAVVAQNWLDLSGERGLSSFDQRHAVTFTGQYSTGAGVKGGALMTGWRGAAFKDWTISTQITAGSGLPLNPVYAVAIPGTGVIGPLRPEYTGSPLYVSSPGVYLNAAAYAVPPAGQFGNAGRNSITGPDQFSLGASMTRTFQLRDRMNMDLRFDSLNTLNHVSFTGWNTTLNSPQFGEALGANAMRTVTATVRVRF